MFEDKSNEYIENKTKYFQRQHKVVKKKKIDYILGSTVKSIYTVLSMYK